MLRPHGGPHSVTTDEFAAQTALLLAAGVAVLQPNYRGSLSFGADFGEALLGQVGANPNANPNPNLNPNPNPNANPNSNPNPNYCCTTAGRT